MAHPSDAPLRAELGRFIQSQINDKLERLIVKPEERTAGYIAALRDILRVLNDGDSVPLDFHSTTQDPPNGSR